MQKARHFPLRGSSRDCKFCASMGLGGVAQDKFVPGELAAWLGRSGYRFQVLGCGKEPPPVLPELQIIRCVHRLEDVADGGFYWLVVDRLTEALRELVERKSNLRVIVVPAKSDGDLAAQLRRWPRRHSGRLSVHWPHFSLLSQFGWTWEEAVAVQRSLATSLPYLELHPPHGWDLHNPQFSDDLDLEAPPASIIDRRPPEFYPDISVIIPSYNCLHPLRSTLHQLLKSSGHYEILVADDGSHDLTADWFKRKSEGAWPENLVYLGMVRPRPREMGDGEFRAGIARNTAAPFSRGKYLLFLDSDILLPANYLEQLVKLHEEYDLIQGTRLQLRHVAPALGIIEYEEIQREHLESLTEPWEKFNVQNWDKLPNKWKFVSTFCLSIAREQFFALGAFRRSFFKYGFEDTDLGYRAAKAGLRFHRSPAMVYHFKHGNNRSEYRHKIKIKHQLLRDSAKVFFLNNPDPKILSALPQFLIDPPESRFS